MNNADEPARRFPAPPPQRNLDRATELGFEALRGQTGEQLQWLGAETTEDVWRVLVLGDVIEVDRAACRVTTPSGDDVGPHWRILVLHYLVIGSRPEKCEPTIAFADLTTARSYNKVYQGRTTGRLCGTVGQTRGALCNAAAKLGGRPATGGDVAFDFDLFPQVAFRVVWHAPDEEFPPSATILLPSNIESFFCSEDIVVLSERLVSRLCGRPF